MKGKYRIVIQNNKIKYDFEIVRNITIIRGDSATGKTALVNMVRDFYENEADSGVELQCQKTCAVLEGRSWQMQLAAFHDCIVFIDEGNNFVASKVFAAEIQKTNNYYVIVTREALSNLPYSVSEIYGIRDSGKYGYLKKTYNELYQIYGHNQFDKKVFPNLIITEDSNSGFQFFKAVCDQNEIACLSAGGKSNIFKMLTEHDTGKVLVIADGAAIGAEINKLTKLVESRENLILYLPESFEWLILKSGIIDSYELSSILRNPYEFVESIDFFSWERFFASVLIEQTKNSYLKYSKHKLNTIYLQENITNRILAVMEIIELNKK